MGGRALGLSLLLHGSAVGAALWLGVVLPSRPKREPVELSVLPPMLATVQEQTLRSVPLPDIPEPSEPVLVESPYEFEADPEPATELAAWVPALPRARGVIGLRELPGAEPAVAAQESGQVLAVAPAALGAPAAEPPAVLAALAPETFTGARPLANACTEPAYPRLARRHGQEGTVKLRVKVGADGLPQAVELALSSGFELLDQAALEAVRGWRFEPARRNDQPVADEVIVPLRFYLVDPGR